MNHQRFLLLQINDALFPIGGYSHSYGLETYIQKQLVFNKETAFEYVECNLRYNFLYTELLAVRFAYEAAINEKIEKILELEEIINASKTPMEIRLAGQKLGSRFMKTLLPLKVDYNSNIFNQFEESCSGKMVNHSVAYGVFTAAIGCSYQTAIETYLYAQTSAMVTNCVKTIPLSQTTGQQLLYKSYRILDEIIENLSHCTMEELCLATPGFDIRCMQHEGLYSRLYMS